MRSFGNERINQNSHAGLKTQPANIVDLQKRQRLQQKRRNRTFLMLSMTIPERIRMEYPFSDRNDVSHVVFIRCQWKFISFTCLPLVRRFITIIAAIAVFNSLFDNQASVASAFSFDNQVSQRDLVRRTKSSLGNEAMVSRFQPNKSVCKANQPFKQCGTKREIILGSTSSRFPSSQFSSLTSTTLFLEKNRDEQSGGMETSQSTSSSNSNPSDESEWRALLASLTMYKAAYGDLKVPQRFVVPNMAPWPKPAWGLKLGKDVYAIRSTGKYISGQPKRRQQLDRLDFAWSVRRNSSNESEEKGAVTLEQIILAASTYRRLNNDLSDSVAESIPDNYVVPDSDPWPESVRSLPLGRQLEVLQRNCPPALREKLEDLKILPKAKASTTDDSSVNPATFSLVESSDSVDTEEESTNRFDEKMPANDLRFQKVFLALKTYRKIHGDLLVPQPFTVPGGKNSEWPEEIWGLRLGARVNAIRSQGTFVNSNPERRQMLDDLGFVWSPPKELKGRRGRKPRSEKIDTDDDFDEMEERDSPKNSEEGYGAIDSLFDGSFDFGQDFDAPDMFDKSSTSLPSSPSWDLDKARLPDVVAKAAAEKEAVMKDDEYLPPRTLGESLEEATNRALEVGVISGMTPNNRVIKGKREKDIPWFNDDFGDYFVFDDVVEALTTYKSIYGGFSNLTENFVVPSPKEVTGFLEEDDDFGSNVFDTFDVAASARAAAAIADFEKQGQSDRSDDLIAAEIKRLQEEVGQGGVSTATKTETSRSLAWETEQWAEHLAGMRLGSIVLRIRDGSLEVKHIPERKAQLDAIGFDWGDPKYFLDIPFEKAMCAMYAYYLVRGDMFVYEDFVMPDEDPWPQVLAGYELGKAVKRIRELQNFLEAYHPDKVSLLRMIDFIWFSDTVALPLDPNEREMTSETLLLSAMGHPDYAKMIDIPMGLPDKIISDGPFMDTGDDPKLWWRKWHNWDYVKDYWYQQGRRDNAFVLRRTGYPQMADEHEAKYGPGLFKEIDDVMNILETGIDDLSHDEKEDILERLNYFRHEMIGCTDILPRERDQLIANLDMQMVRILKGIKLEISTEDEMESADYEYEEYSGGEYDERENPATNIEDKDNASGEIYEGEEFDLEDELGFRNR